MPTKTLPGEPIEGTNSTRMFSNDLIEWFSRIHPATIFVAWLPVIAWALFRSRSHYALPFASIAAYVAIGTFVWTFAEYVLHRWIFHWTNDTRAGKRIHFLLHGVHHDYPNDKDRLVMPLPTSVPLALIFYGLFALGMGHAAAHPFFAGFALGYLAYDGTHYYVHHFRPTTRVGKFLRKHHMIHHHADAEGGFGVSSPLWDLVFKTMPKKRTDGPKLR
jgi:sterol desaturase/sphingolipid hydroxylase (fatty acid hydroxylase superfamily)